MEPESNLNIERTIDVIWNQPENYTAQQINGVYSGRNGDYLELHFYFQSRDLPSKSVISLGEDGKKEQEKFLGASNLLSSEFRCGIVIDKGMAQVLIRTINEYIDAWQIAGK